MGEFLVSTYLLASNWAKCCFELTDFGTHAAVRSCSEITCTYDAGQTFICKEENAAVAGIRHEVAPALAGDGVLMPCAARLSNVADERLDKSDVQVIL